MQNVDGLAFASLDMNMGRSMVIGIYDDPQAIEPIHC